MATFEPNSWVWVRDETEKYLPAKVLTAFAPGTATTVLTDDGERRKLTAEESSQVCECNAEALNSSISDLIDISDLNEMSILHNLRIRFKENAIYTSISSILVSVNPFQLLPLYTPAVLETYRAGGSKNNPPHVFGIAYNAYNCMLSDGANQSVVISGESGAGKSEATKLILQFLAEVSQRATAGAGGEDEHGEGDAAPAASAGGNAMVTRKSTRRVLTNSATGSSTALEQQLLAANPILEAFGNAKTLRNNNSSRFGKLITVKFDPTGGIVGGSIINYLLEKSRVVTQSAGERNYHIFYQLLAGCEDDPALGEALKAQNAEMFSYTNQSGVTRIEGVNDDKEFEDVNKSFDLLDFSAAEKREVFRIVAGVLHLGNLKFRDEKKDKQDDGSAIVNPDVATLASELWGIDSAELQKFLTSKYIGSRDLILVNYNLQQATDARDALVKRVYSELFQVMVNRINDVLSGACGDSYKNFIGVLDIFGFESFKVNSFEQLCINYCNEKLQFHFNEHIFSMEQSVYAAEGVTIPGSSFVDNQPTLDLLELKGTGIFSLCDEEIAMPKGSDDTLLNKIMAKHGDRQKPHPNLAKPKTGRENASLFGVVHYAGTVYYDVTNFLDKNKDQLNIDLIGMLKKSSSKLVVDMFAPFDDREAQNKAASGGRRMSVGAGGGKPKTLGGQFKMQLKDLIDTLNATNPHFIRCMKPNDEKVGGVFNSQRMQDQLRYAGLVEVCRIRKLGFPIRRAFVDFFKRYKCCVTDAKACTGVDDLVEYLSSTGKLQPGEWAKGHSKMFLRTAQAADLDKCREQALSVHAAKVQRVARKYVCMRKFASYKKILAKLASATAARATGPLKAALEDATDLPHGGRQMPVVLAAKQLMVRLADEERVANMLDAAINSRDLTGLTSALKEANQMSPPFDVNPGLMQTAQELVARLESENVLRADLTKAIAGRAYDAIVDLLGKAAAMGFDCAEVKQGQTLKARLEEENRLLEALNAAVAAKDLAALGAAINACVEGGMTAAKRPEVGRAETLKEELQVIQAREREAAAKQLEESARKAKEEADAAELERQRQEEEKAKAKRSKMLAKAKVNIKMATSTRDLAALDASIQHGLEIGLDEEHLQEATVVHKRLVEVDSATKQLQGELRLLKFKQQVGIFESDLKIIVELTSNRQLMDEVDDAILMEALSGLQNYRKQAVLNEELQMALKSPDMTVVRNALNNAEDTELSNDLVTAVREKLRRMEENASGRNALRGKGAANAPMVSFTDVEAARTQRLELAANARFGFKNYPNLRSVDNFARGAIFNKAALKESFLSFSKDEIPKSLTEMTFQDHNKLAIQCFKNILGYMGDKIVQYPSMLARDLLQKGLENVDLRPEIYLQVIKQITGNPRPESISRGWQLLAMCVGTFAPPDTFLHYLIHFILEKKNKSRGATSEYAKYCLRSLESTLNAGEATSFIPSTAEIESYRDRPPILATLELVDGHVIAEDVPITPDQNVAKVLEMCARWLDLTDKRMDTLGIFVYDAGEYGEPTPDQINAPYYKLKRTPRPLRNDDYLGDILVIKARQRRNFKFVVKKKIFLPDEPPSADPNYERLLFLQAEHDVIVDGVAVVHHEECAVDLAAISMVLAFAEETPTTVEALVEGGVADFVAPGFREGKSPEEWATILQPVVTDLLSVDDTSGLQREFISRASSEGNCHMYGTHWFYVYKNAVYDEKEAAATAAASSAAEGGAAGATGFTSKSLEILKNLPEELLFGFNCDGFHVCDLQRKVLIAYEFVDVSRWGGSSSQFSIILSDHSCDTEEDESPDVIELSVITSQAQDMASIIMDYINALIKQQQQQEA